ATLLAPERADYQLLLARTYYQAGFLALARRRFEAVAALSPADADARLGLAEVWRRDWLHYLDPPSLARAIAHDSAAVALDPALEDGWLMLSSLRIEAGDVEGAAAAARQALANDPDRAEALLAAGSTRWRLGDVEGADSAFQAALPRLSRSIRDRFEDIAPLASEQDTAVYNHLSAAGRAEFARRFWRDHDPDLTTAANEAQLEYWARVAQAYFLYYDAHRREWDERGEVYVRYGPPERVDYNPVGEKLYAVLSRRSAMQYPANVLVWSYPSLGMSVTLQDRILSQYYQLPISYDEDPDPRPDPDSLAAHDALTTPDGRGVFPRLPPRTRPLAVSGQLARFEGTGGRRLFAGVAAPGGPGDTLQAEFVVLDSSFHEIVRQHRTLSPSACDPAGERSGDFAAALPPGDYRVGLSVRGGGGRGSVREAIHLAPADTALSVSDVVVTCGAPQVVSAPVRIEPNPPARVPAGAPLVAYFEVYHLATGADGTARFEYETTVTSTRHDPRIWLERLLDPRPAPPGLSALRTDTVTGPLRRQFVSVPVQSLPPGPYRLEVRVRDLRTGDERTATADFVREAAAAR
ncbi:MAG TPA: GWxTD domain-containing protein, partial [Candidatus Eisenbacteria bacterium]|nr:GWxTD domain-containing protein [Candidatus Eisenbacteria bacterium]